MSKLVFLAIASGSMAMGAGLAAWRQQAPSPVQQAPSAEMDVPQVTPFLATAAATPAVVEPVVELDPDADTTGLLLEAPTVEEFLDLADSTSAQPLDAADREQLAKLLRSDAALRKQFR